MNIQINAFSRVPINVMTVVIFTVGLGFATHAAAQASTSTSSNEISVYAGELLPNGIDNVTEILPLLGARYGIQTAHLGVAELGLFNVHAKGVDFTTVEASLRGQATISPGVEGLYYGGLDLNYYTPLTETDRRTAAGFHAGAGALFQVTDSLWFRGDLKLMSGPGSSLLMLFGIVVK